MRKQLPHPHHDDGDDDDEMALAITDHRQKVVLGRTYPQFMDDRHAPDFEFFRNLFYRRRNVFFTIAGGFLAIVIALTLLSPKTYTTTTKLIVGNSGSGASAQAGNADTSLPVVNALVGAAGVRTPETYVELIQEIPVAQRVIDDINLQTSAKRLLAGVVAKPVTDTQIIELSVAWKDPQT